MVLALLSVEVSGQKVHAESGDVLMSKRRVPIPQKALLLLYIESGSGWMGRRGPGMTAGRLHGKEQCCSEACTHGQRRSGRGVRTGSPVQRAHVLMCCEMRSGVCEDHGEASAKRICMSRMESAALTYCSRRIAP